MTVSITCYGNFNCIGHCCAWDWSDFVSNCIMGLFWTGDWIQVRHNVDSFSSITRPIKRRSVTSRYHLSWQRRPFASSNDARKYGLLFCSWVQSCTGKSYMSSCFRFFFPYLQDHVLLRSKNNFAKIATWRNDFSSLFKKKKDDKTAAINFILMIYVPN